MACCLPANLPEIHQRGLPLHFLIFSLRDIGLVRWAFPRQLLPGRGRDIQPLIAYGGGGSSKGVFPVRGAQRCAEAERRWRPL